MRLVIFLLGAGGAPARLTEEHRSRSAQTQTSPPSPRPPKYTQGTPSSCTAPPRFGPDPPRAAPFSQKKRTAQMQSWSVPPSPFSGLYNFVQLPTTESGS